MPEPIRVPIHGDKHPRECCVCNQYRLSNEYHLIRIDYRARPITLAEVDRGYAGIRAVCVWCRSGLASLAPLGRENAGQTHV